MNSYKKEIVAGILAVIMVAIVLIAPSAQAQQVTLCAKTDYSTGQTVYITVTGMFCPSGWRRA